MDGVFIFQLMRNIWRQRHLSQLIQNLFKNSVIMELNQTISLFHNIDDFTRQKSITKNDLRARFCLLSRLDKCLPDIVFHPLQQNKGWTGAVFLLFWEISA